METTSVIRHGFPGSRVGLAWEPFSSGVGKELRPLFRTGEERRHAHVDGAAYPLAQVAEQADRV